MEWDSGPLPNIVFAQDLRNYTLESGSDCGAREIQIWGKALKIARKDPFRNDLSQLGNRSPPNKMLQNDVHCLWEMLEVSSEHLVALKVCILDIFEAPTTVSSQPRILETE